MKTAVIGAGLAGLIVAQRIAAREGADAVQVFEKSRGPGGRTSTRRSDQGGFDHGAQYFTVRDPRLETLLDGWKEAGAVAAWDGRFHTLKNGSLGPDPRPDALRFVGAPRMSALARHLSEGLELATETRVTSVDRRADGWQLQTEKAGAIGAFERVIVATPAAQAAPLLSAIPQLARIANSVEIAPCQAVMVTFSEPLDPGFDGAFVEDSALSWVARQASKPGRAPSASFVLHGTTEWSEAHLHDPAEQVAASLVRAFATALGRTLPGIDHLQAHRWLYALPKTPLSRGFCWEPDQRIGVCGDWLAGARVEAALLSGLALADAILET